MGLARAGWPIGEGWVPINIMVKLWGFTGRNRADETLYVTRDATTGKVAPEVATTLSSKLFGAS